MSEPIVRELRPEDWPQVAAIYAEGIATGDATFETEVPAWAVWDAAHPGFRLVVEDAAGIAGWAATSAYSDRCCYRGVAEESVYVAARARGRGVGRLLLGELVARTEAAGIWTLQAGVFPENKPSLRLHLGCGFRLVGVRERLGELHGAWRDVLLLERRSATVG
ncbi:MAG TPA: GNAT family N-acetyltransferase [Gaiellaceae bacterium]|nr:GNAT family N-acetyltransferase [Gaiellaceae bacterium]